MGAGPEACHSDCGPAACANAGIKSVCQSMGPNLLHHDHSWMARNNQKNIFQCNHFHHSLQPLAYRAETAMGYFPSDVQRQQHQ